ncbi:MAG TPA: hypothetical protein PLZ52_02710 [Bacteroidales bacterium]|nr:hypothetical protein [Bacteroidales bacterium]HQL70940.1 hypothetical protein [Bacteroidales bacterium]
MKKLLKRKLTKNEIILIVILGLAIIGVITSHKRIADKIDKVWNIYSGKPAANSKPSK